MNISVNTHLVLLKITFLFSILLIWLHRVFVVAMAPHSSTLAWKIPRMEKPGRLQSTGSLRVGHD